MTVRVQSKKFRNQNKATCWWYSSPQILVSPIQNEESDITTRPCVGSPQILVSPIWALRSHPPVTQESGTEPIGHKKGKCLSREWRGGGVTGADPGFWSRGGPTEFWPQGRGGSEPKFAQNRVISLKIAWQLHDVEKKCEGKGGALSTNTKASLHFFIVLTNRRRLYGAACVPLNWAEQKQTESTPLRGCPVGTSCSIPQICIQCKLWHRRVRMNPTIPTPETIKH